MYEIRTPETNEHIASFEVQDSSRGLLGCDVV